MIKSTVSVIVKNPTIYCLLILCISAAILNNNYPLVGIDYSLFIPRLLDTYLFYLNNGLHIQWWTPSFGGGVPAYPNPLHIQFSLPQLLVCFFDPWRAIIITMAVLSAIGYASMYFLLFRMTDAGKDGATLGAVLWSVSTFFIHHLSAGLLNFQAFPLLPLTVWMCIDRNVSLPARISLLSLSLAYQIYSAGFYHVIIFGISVPLSIALLFVLSEDHRIRLRNVALTILLSLPLAFCISLSKLTAIQSFTRYFPRLFEAHYQISLLKSVAGLAFQLFYTPLAILLPHIPVDHHLRRMTGAQYGLWELDIGISPVVLFIFIFAFLFISANPFRLVIRFVCASRRRIILFVFIGLLSLLAIEFTFARGYPYFAVKELPFFASLHGNTRNASIFILPLVICTIAARRYLAVSDKTKPVRIFLNPWGLSLAAILLYAAYIRIPQTYGYTHFSAAASVAEWKSMRSRPESYFCNRIMDIKDDKVFGMHASNLHPYEPIFGYQLEDFAVKIHEGPVENDTSAYFNMTNPASLVFPDENGLRHFDRIAKTDRKNFEAFINYRMPHWKVWKFQHAVNCVSVLACIGTMLLLFAGTCRSLIFRRLILLTSKNIDGIFKSILRIR